MILNNVCDKLLTANGLEKKHLDKLLTKLASSKIDFGDIYFQKSYYESFALDERLIKRSSYHQDQGVGIRAIVGEKTGFSYTDKITLPALEASIIAAKSISEHKIPTLITPLIHHKNALIYQPHHPINDINAEFKVQLLHDIDKLARSIDKRVVEVSASLSSSYEEILVASTDGTLAADIRPLVHLSIVVLVEQDNMRERGNAGGGGRLNYDYFMQINPKTNMPYYESYTHEAVKMALVALSAKAVPAGTMPVILGSSWPAVLLHEAVGHGLEGDFNRKGTSVFSGKMGEMVTSPLCTIVDDATVPNHRGSLTIDDEGVVGQKTILIENGILKNYMFDKQNAKLMGTKSTGNGRRESYAHLPMPRMTNTYMLNGKSTIDEMISSVDFGIYAPGLSGGQVDITSGKFVFSTSEAYLIKNGKITHPVKGATLIGSGSEAMQNISMIGNDMALDAGVGMCGKSGQNLPVGVGQPTLKVDKLTVGGTATSK